MPSDVVVVLNYNGRSDTEKCVASLVSGSPEATVLVVDNGSTDGVIDGVSARWPGVHTIQNPRNLGFAGGMNTGVRWALAHGADTVTVLNNDTVVPPGVLQRLCTVARTGVVVSPEVRYADGSEKVWFGGGAIDVDTGLARHLSESEFTQLPLEDGFRLSPVLAGCCLTATAETWSTVGLFDERYFLNFEDSEWSMRASRTGVPLVVDPSVHIYHRVSASFAGAYSYLGLFFYTRNGLLFIREGLKGPRRQAIRFLRRHVLTGLVHRLRQRDWAELGRRTIVVACALWCRARSSYGAAPTWLERVAARWSLPG